MDGTGDGSTVAGGGAGKSGVGVAGGVVAVSRDDFGRVGAGDGVGRSTLSGLALQPFSSQLHSNAADKNAALVKIR
jgi:hypothetical protein